MDDFIEELSAPVEQEAAPEVTQEAPKVEAEAPAQAQPQAVKEPPKHDADGNTVPSGLYVETRKRAVAAERAAMEAKQQFEQLKAEFEALRNPKPAAPKPDDDPFAYLEYQQKEQFNQLGSKLDAVAKDVETRRSMERQASEVHQNVSKIAEQEQAFVAANPDYYDALEHVRTVQRENLREFGFTPEQINKFVAEQEYNTGLQGLAIGENPAKIVYNMAKRFGYRKADPVKQEVTPQVASKMEMFQNGQQAARTLGSNGSPDTVKDDSDSNDFPEFDMAWKSLGYKKR